MMSRLMNRTRPLTRLPARAALTVLLFLPGAAALADTALRIGVQDRIVHAVLALGVARGDFEQEGLSVQLIVPPDGTDADPTTAAADQPVGPAGASQAHLDALVDGRLDLMATGADTLLVAEQAGINLRGALLLGESGQADLVLGTPPTQSAGGLRGARVALVSGDPGRLLLAAELQRRGLNLDEVDLERVPAADALVRWQDSDEATSLQAIAIAAPASIGFLAALADATHGTAPSVLLGDAGDHPGLITDLLAGQERWLRDNRDAMKRLVRAWNLTVGALRRDPAANIALLAEQADLEVEVAGDALAGVELFGVEDNIRLLRGDFQKRFSSMSQVLARIDRERARGVPSANRFLALSALRQVAAGR